MNTLKVNRAGLSLSVLLFVITPFVFAEPEKRSTPASSEPLTTNQEQSVSGQPGNSQESEAAIKSSKKSSSISPETFIPTEDISRDLSVSFPVDI